MKSESFEEQQQRCLEIPAKRSGKSVSKFMKQLEYTVLFFKTCAQLLTSISVEQLQFALNLQHISIFGISALIFGYLA